MSNSTIYKKRWFRVGTAISILVVGIAAMSILAATKEETNKKEATQRVRQVATTPLIYADHTLQIHGNGSIESQQLLDLVSFVGGEVVYSRGDLKSGLQVNQGDILLKIDDREAQNRILQARSGLINAIVSLIPELRGNAQDKTYKKWNDYLEQLNMSTTPELPLITDAQERIRVSMHNIFNQHATVKNTEITLDRHTIRAPFDGYLVNDGVIAGTWISPGQVAVSLINPFQLEIAVPLALSELDLLSDDEIPTAIVTPSEDPSKHLTGILHRQNAHIDKRSQTVTIHVELSNPDLDPAFLPGNYMDIYIQGNKLQNVALLPRDVIAPGPYVYTMEDSLLARYPVEIVASEGDSLLIARGEVAPGSQVVTTLLQSPIIGMRIAPFDEESTADTASL
jgi:RND family efflux transporter MFP subunit